MKSMETRLKEIFSITGKVIEYPEIFVIEDDKTLQQKYCNLEVSVVDLNCRIIISAKNTDECFDNLLSLLIPTNGQTKTSEENPG